MHTDHRINQDMHETWVIKVFQRGIGWEVRHPGLDKEYADVIKDLATQLAKGRNNPNLQFPRPLLVVHAVYH